MVDPQAITIEADYKRITFLRAADRARAERNARAQGGHAHMQPSAGLGGSLASATVPNRPSGVQYPVWGWIGRLRGRPAWGVSIFPAT